MNINKDSIRELIGQGKISKAIEQLQLLIKGKDSDLANTILLQHSRLKSLKKQELMGVLTYEQASQTRNQIIYALLSLMDEIEDASEDKPVSVDTDKNEEKPSSRNILFVAANPRDSNPIRLGEEFSKIKSSLQWSEKRDQFYIQQEWAAEVKGLRRAMLNHTPFIVHFSGHGSERGGIILEDSEGYSHVVEVKAMGDFFALFKDFTECVLLNACYSEEQANEISKHIPYVIGVKDKIPDETSIAFSEAFYEAIGTGSTIEESFKFARNNIAMSGMDGEDLPVLMINAMPPESPAH